MAVRIRLARFGRRNHPIYRIVVMDSRRPREGKYIDIIGTYDPKRHELIKFDEEKYLKWVSLGAEVTERAKAIYKLYKKLTAKQNA
ncbi:MAG TPA: 30S ribosomal protein S16 [Aquifex aeolicus]|uniref:Small ribosomal subunit protein bS16 n=1 Tax=Aquifex aeolicus TaxID=63363 RepID=A0A9D0YPX2_AQUAO|nr:30S ribosomal protein S16 [Aquificales bacterium]HIP86701.1 30S ribosomal protein S16 [Aquifex sp.]HIP98886.1 30S ribosomal protein S16 [Aquifex aeolicus]HIQ26197.1 30S ribosomal protein S16 [Aquifex aeolicus]